MEDDDEFGDLYTDVLRPLMTTSFQQQQQQQQQQPGRPPSKESPRVTSASATSYLGRPIDLNVTSDDEVREEDKLVGGPNSRPPPQNQTLTSSSSSQPGVHSRPDARTFDLNEEFGLESGNSEGFVGLELDSQARGAADGNARLPRNAAGNGSSDFMDTETEIDIVVQERDEKDDDFVIKDEKLADKTKATDNFSVGEGAINGLGLDTEVPGLSIPGVSGVESRADPSVNDDWDSDSDDDLQIVLNDNTHGPMGMERMGGGAIGDEDDDDEDGDPLVIVADNNDPGHQPMIMEEQEWVGEDAGPSADGEKKEAGETGKVNGGALATAPKIGYGPHGYHHPFHSQFKYVRPGASPIPGAAPAGPGVDQVRPPVGMPPGTGRGRGDWRPAGMKGGSAVQKGFYQGYGVPVWGGTGRGLDFTLPSHKTIFEVDIDGFEEKPWRINGVDISDFFNFGLTEESWKDYSKQLVQLRAGTTMHGKIRVYESGRAEQEYDPDLPPELAAAVVQDKSSDGVKFGKSDTGLGDLARVAHVRPPLPTGRPIQVETGSGERLPSIDTRKPRMSDLDVIIEIVCQDLLDDDTKRMDEMTDQAEIDSVREDLPDVNELEEPQEDAEHLSHSPHAYDSRKREVDGRRVPSVHNNDTEEDDASAFNRAASPEYHTDSREQTPNYPERNSTSSHEDRYAKGRAHSGSPVATIKERIGKRSPDIKDSPFGSMEGKSSLASSPGSVGISAELKDSINDGIVRMEKGLDMDEGELALNGKMKNDTISDETRHHPSKKQKLNSQEVDDQDDSKAARSSENSKARSGSSNYRKLQDVEDEEVQDGRATRRSNLKRAVGEDEVNGRRKARDDRQETERQRSAVGDREDLYQHKGWDSQMTRRRDVDEAEGAHQRRDEDIHRRRTREEDTKKREYREKSGSRQQSKARENERHEKDERLLSRKQLDNGNWRGNFDKDIAIRPRDRDDGMKIRNENLDDIYNKRRKEEAHFFKELAGKEQSLHAHRESSSRRKRERDDVPDQRKRDDQGKTRDDDLHSARHKEREEWYGHKQMNQESQAKMEAAAQVGIRSGRAAEDKARENQSRGKDEHRRSKELHPKDVVRPHELHGRRDRVENVNLSQHRGREDFYHGNPLNHDERRARIERAVTRDDHASDNYRVHENKHRDIPRKGKESEAVDRDSLAHSKKHQDETSGRAGDRVRPKGRVENFSSENEIHASNPISKKPRDEASSDDELSESRRGRSKLERWNSHKERDFGTSSKSPSSMKIRQIESYNNSSGPSVDSRLNNESKTVEDKQQRSGSEKDAGAVDMNTSDKKPLEDRHLDTVEKLKKRSERFKLPMPSEKDASAIKKSENEQLPPAPNENRSDFEIKAERPARKRRWTGS